MGRGTSSAEVRAARRVAAQNTVIAGLEVDVLVLTEPPAARSIAGARTVVSPVEREGDLGKEAWVAIVGDGAEPVGDPLPFHRLAAIARVERAPEPLIVYGSVLPWLAAAQQAPELGLSGENYAAMFERVLDAQVADLLALQRLFPNHLLIWAGDFNQSVTGPNFGGSNAGRALLIEACDTLRFAAWNADEAHANPRMCAIDLICGPADRHVRNIDPIPPTFEGRTITDHQGYVVEV